MSLSKVHFVNVSEHGTFKNSKTQPADVDSIFEHLKTSGQKKLAIHFHGGLVKEDEGMKTAERMMNTFADSGAHIVSFVWETGFGETFIRNLNEINDTELFQEILKIITKIVGKELNLTGKGAKGVPVMTDAQVEAELKEPKPLEEYNPEARINAEKINDGKLLILQELIEDDLKGEISREHKIVDLAETEAPKTELIDKDIIEGSKGADAKGFLSPLIIKKLAKAAFSVVKRFVNKSEHDLYPTIIEEIIREFYLVDFGKWMWGNIKKIAEKDMWADNTGINDAENQHVGTYFLQKLNTFKANNLDISIDLIGHSAGSIAIGNLLRNIAILDLENIKIRKIIFLAPACTTKLFHDEIVSHTNRFESFTMFTMRDDREKQDQLLKFVYTHSLLYLVSGAFEEDIDTPILGMQRFLLGNKPHDNNQELNTVIAFLNSSKSKIYYSDTASNALTGARTTSLSHGDFDNDLETLKSIVFTVLN